jgi:hypothetical protein
MCIFFMMMGPLTTSHIFALSIFASYFLLILLLFSTIVSSIRTHANIQNHPKRAVLFSVLAIASFAHTWYCKIFRPGNVSLSLTLSQGCSSS